MLSVTDANFDEILNAPVAVVDFWAPWCPGCVQLKPTMEQLAEDLKDDVLVVGANVDDNEAAAARYEVTGIPATVFMKDGKEVHREIGAMPKGKLRDLVAKHLGI
jgi:thioredoxin 1